MDVLDLLLGLGKEANELSALQMALRAVVIYIVTLAIVRMGKKRFMGRATAFDVIVGIVLGSIASRAITGNAPMFPSMVSAAVVMAMHWLLSRIAVRWHPFGEAIKGGNRPLVIDGRIDEEALFKAHMTIHDLHEALREQGIMNVARVAEARLERNGEVSVIKKSAEPKVVAVDIGAGVQTVRIELG